MAIPHSASPTKTTPDSGEARAVACRVLVNVLQDGCSLAIGMPSALAACANARDRALAQMLCYGVMRQYHRLDAVLNCLLDRRLNDKDTDIKVLILLGLYQLAYTRIPPHAAVFSTVELCHMIGKPWAKKLLNATLRRYQRECDTLAIRIANDRVARYAHPAWLIDLIVQDHPEHWQSILHENNQPPPMTLRVNRQMNSRPNYLEWLAAAGIEGHAAEVGDHAIVLAYPISVHSLPGFPQGAVSIQDAAAQLAVPLLAPRAGTRVLDACAAPGGKLAHLLEYAPDLAEAVAIECQPGRFKLLEETLRRLRINATLICDDICHPERWWDRKPFDQIIVDAPCSASGVVRRHPDIKYLRTPEALHIITGRQAKILDATWPLLKQGGRLLYITCSIFNAENDAQMTAFMQRHSDAKVMPIHADWGSATTHGRHIFPGQQAMDGFYYAQLQKIP